MWVFVIRNAYRPGLVAGQFNGLISNPPWLALSKIANNPFASVLKNKATEYALNPPGAAFPHLEMATNLPRSRRGPLPRCRRRDLMHCP